MKFKTKLLVVAISFAFLAGLFAINDVDEQLMNQPTLEEMQREIQAKGYTFTVGMNGVYGKNLKNLCGLVEPDNWRETGNFDGRGETEATLPTTYDWRDYGKVGPIENQGSCGSCWAFGTIDSYESDVAVAGGSLDNLSEEWLLDCNTYGYSCSGGWWAFGDLTNGAPLESCYPYVGTKTTCQTGCTKYHPLSTWYYVGSSSGVPTTTAIKEAIYNQGPIAAAVYVGSNFQAYTGGIFNTTQTGSPNHAIVLVGWNDTYGYWILKNSWGTSWGESGYMRITYGTSQVGYAAAYGVPSGVTPPTDPYEPNDSYSTAYGAIDSGTNYTGAEISTSSDVDWFHFTTEDTGTITVSVSHESGEDLDWYLYTSTDTTNYVARGYTTSNPETGSYSATWIGKYYVKVVGYNGSTSTYTLNVTYPDEGGGGGGGTYYRIMNRYSGYALDVNSGSSYVYHYAYNGNTDKHWELVSTGDGYYKIINRYNGNCLDVGSSNYTYNYVDNGNTDKHWQIIDLGTGWYRIVSRYNGRDLDVGSGSYVYNYTWNGNTDKQWQFISVD